MPSPGNDQPEDRRYTDPQYSDITFESTTTTTTSEPPPPPVWGGRGGIRSITDAERIEGNVPVSTMPPDGVWKPPSISSTASGSNSEESPHAGDKPLPSAFSYAPIIIEATMNFATLSPAWFLNNKKNVEATLRQTFGLDAYEDAKITRIRAVAYRRRELVEVAGDHDDEGRSAKKIPTATRSVFKQAFFGKQVDENRNLQDVGSSGFNYFGTEIDFLLGLRDESRVFVTENSVRRMEDGDYGMSNTFVLNLKKQLVAEGENPVALEVADISVSNLRTTLPPTTPAPATESQSSDATSAPDADDTETDADAGLKIMTDQKEDEEGETLIHMGLIGLAVAGVVAFAASRRKTAPVHPDGGEEAGWVGPPNKSPTGSFRKAHSMGDMERRGQGSGYRGVRSSPKNKKPRRSRSARSESESESGSSASSMSSRSS